jgi:tRNA threonylcarbamoyladenosine biosynthesis protein TsaB
MDTATDRASVALLPPGGAPLEEELHGARRHAAALLPMIQRLLARGGMKLEDLSGVVLSDGPGSFTGLRVGAAVAKALAHARGVAFATAPSLLVRAAAVAADGATVLAVSNALRGELYGAIFRFGPARVETLLPPRVVVPQALIERAARPDAIVGEAPVEALALLETWSGTRVVRPPQGAPRAALLFDLLEWRGGAEVVSDVESWEPDYGRPAEAQARWEKAHGRALPDPAGSGR